MSFNSYSQNFEDVMLWRALKEVKQGFYIDVGAADPLITSVTAAFYERGWRGINIEPEERYFKQLVKARPRDVNLQVAIGADTGRRQLFVVSQGGSQTGLSTTVKAIADGHCDGGFAVSEQPVEVVGLAQVCREHAHSEIHFLKIDVEGSERDVLTTMDFVRYRPWIVLLEATEPNTQIPAHEQWEDVLMDADYQFVWFDGLNRFYVSAEKFEDLQRHFKLPPNVHDGFVRVPEAYYPIARVLPPDPLIERTPVAVNEEARAAMTVRCRDADAIPKTTGAGAVFEDPELGRFQLMHNGLKVSADGYCGQWMTRLIEACRGHHEPQEELVFHKVVETLPASAAMIELGGNWSYYSLWFLQRAPGRRAIIVEPDPANRAVGEGNAKLNGLSAEFIAAFVGRTASAPTPFKTERSGVVSLPRVTVADLMQQKGIEALDILHCDTQGAEFDVLASCEDLFRERRIRWVFISTHSHQITGDPLTHQRCLELLIRSGGCIEAEHDVHESFSGDGLIVARFGAAPDGWRPVELSRNRYSTSLFRNPLYDLASELRRSQGPTPEEIASIVRAVYRAILLRDPDPRGLADFSNAIATKAMNVQKVIETILRSNESKSKQMQFRARYFENATDANAQADQMRYLRKGGPLECVGFQFKLTSDCALGNAAETIVAPFDKIILPALFDRGDRKIEHLKWATEAIDPSRKYALVDIGANIGLFSRQFLTAFPNLVTCICVEPDATNFGVLSYNLRDFADRDLRLFNFALAAVEDSVKFFRDRENIGNYSLNSDAMRNRPFDETKVRSVATSKWATETLMTIGDLILKTDTQGNDESIVTQMPHEIWDKVAFACFEIWRIEKPPFDRDRFRAIIESFPHRSFGGAVDIEVGAILDYAAGLDWRHEDLYLWR